MTTQQRIERIAEECANTVTIENFFDLKNAIAGALTAFSEETQNEYHHQLNASQILREWAEGKRVVPDCLRRVPFMTMGLLADVFDELQCTLNRREA